MIREMKALDYSKEIVLIVDDDPSLRITLEKLLSAIGFSVRTASSADDALKMILDGEFTFVLTDMKMPGMSGMDLIREISNKSLNINVIAMTGYADGYSYVDVINSGASDFIKKPFGIEELEAKLRRILVERNLREELSRLSITDSLTDLFNQRHFYSRLQEEITRAGRQNYSLSLILLDLDGFKDYNDHHGHLAGDEVLRNTGRIINKCIREGVDSGYRYGGDEFAVILIDADLNIAQEIGERIKRVFDAGTGVTVSLGYAKYNMGMTVKELVEEADKALYKAKHKRNSNRK
ncbi:MAG: diguanylate cyclase [Deltaproteobacteria bacterium]|nr:diguanylate cyclase [Deltaproteobacteria bacterium]